MQIFQDLSVSKFSLNGRELFKTFIPVYVSDQVIRIVNIYDSSSVLIPNTPVSEIQLDGNTYNDATALNNAIHDALFSQAISGDLNNAQIESNRLAIVELQNNSLGTSHNHDNRYYKQEIIDQKLRDLGNGSGLSAGRVDGENIIFQDPKGEDILSVDAKAFLAQGSLVKFENGLFELKNSRGRTIDSTQIKAKEQYYDTFEVQVDKETDLNDLVQIGNFTLASTVEDQYYFVVSKESDVDFTDTRIYLLKSEEYFDLGDPQITTEEFNAWAIAVEGEYSDAVKYLFNFWVNGVSKGIDFTTDNSLVLDSDKVLRANITVIGLRITDFTVDTLNFPFPITKIVDIRINQNHVDPVPENIISATDTSVTLNYFEDIPEDATIYAIVHAYATQPGEAFNEGLTDLQVRAIFGEYETGGDLDIVAKRGANATVPLTAPGFIIKNRENEPDALQTDKGGLKLLSELASAEEVAAKASRAKVENIQELSTLEGIENESVDVLGFDTKGDGGGGQFYWDATSTEDSNEGTIFQVTGLTAGRWKRFHTGLINVKWFGAKGDDSTDDSIAITKAIQYCKTTNQTLFFPYATYLCNLDITQGHSGGSNRFNWLGEKIRTTLKAFDNTKDVIKWNVSNYLVGLSFENLSFNANGGTSNHAWWGDKIHYSTFRNCEYFGGWMGFRARSFGHSYSNCYFDGAYGYAGIGDSGSYAGWHNFEDECVFKGTKVAYIVDNAFAPAQSGAGNIHTRSDFEGVQGLCVFIRNQGFSRTETWQNNWFEGNASSGTRDTSDFPFNASGVIPSMTIPPGGVLIHSGVASGSTYKISRINVIGGFPGAKVYNDAFIKCDRISDNGTILPDPATPNANIVAETDLYGTFEMPSGEYVVEVFAKNISHYIGIPEGSPYPSTFKGALGALKNNMVYDSSLKNRFLCANIDATGASSGLTFSGTGTVSIDKNEGLILGRSYRITLNPGETIDLIGPEFGQIARYDPPTTFSFAVKTIEDITLTIGVGTRSTSGTPQPENDISGKVRARYFWKNYNFFSARQNFHPTLTNITPESITFLLTDLQALYPNNYPSKASGHAAVTNFITGNSLSAILSIGKKITPAEAPIPVATDETLGGIKVGPGLSINEEGVTSVKVGQNLNVDKDGLLNAEIPEAEGIEYIRCYPEFIHTNGVIATRSLAYYWVAGGYCNYVMTVDVDDTTGLTGNFSLDLNTPFVADTDGFKTDENTSIVDNRRVHYGSVCSSISGMPGIISVSTQAEGENSIRFVRVKLTNGEVDRALLTADEVAALSGGIQLTFKGSFRINSSN